MLKRVLVPVVMFCLISLPAYAGWVQVNKSGDTTFISGGMIKEMPKDQGHYTVLDANKGNFMLVDTGRKIYAQDSIDNFCRSMASSMEQALKSLPKEARAALEKMRSRRKAPVVSVEKAGDGGTIAGYRTVKYRVTADGRPYQELWLTTDADLVKEIGKLYPVVMNKVSSCMAAASAAGGPTATVEDSAAYRKVVSSGWEMKSITRSDMGSSSTEVVKLERKNIPSSEFAVPAGYKKVPLSQLMSGR